jgi:hypothetical protein
VGAAAVFTAAAGGVMALGLGIGRLWATLGLLVASRAVALLLRFRTDHWLVLGPTHPSAAAATREAPAPARSSS